jgi:signal transduction histidine kinase
MIHHFLANNRRQILERCRTISERRGALATTMVRLETALPLLLDQIIHALTAEQSSRPKTNGRNADMLRGGRSPPDIGQTASESGRALFALGFSIGDVVRGYGDLCQAVTEIAHERDAPFQVSEFRTLNLCLDDAIASAVTEFTYVRDNTTARLHAGELREQTGAFGYELRNLLDTAILAFTALKEGNLSVTSATGYILERNLESQRDLINRTMADLSDITTGLSRTDLFSLDDLVEEVKRAALVAAKVRGCTISVAPVNKRLTISGDRDLLYGVLTTLVQNAFKFTHDRTEITLRAYAVADSIHIAVQDHCGGLATNDVEQLFTPFTQHGKDRTGLGLGLSIARNHIESMDGILVVRDIPGEGCVFTIRLPRFEVPDA